MRKGQIILNPWDIIGKRLGKLKVVRYAGYTYSHTKGGMKVRHYYWCKCDCGCAKFIQRGPLLNGIVHSCGCLRKKGGK